MSAVLEHANITVADPNGTAAWMEKVFGWHVRWEGEAKNGGYTVHVGEENSYLALYTPRTAAAKAPESYGIIGGLNHVAVIVEDLDATEAAVKAAGFTPMNHGDYEPGRRFYFHDENGIEYEAVQYD
ncbi:MULTISPECIES: VOC family protein [unclassified Leisingera]|uniref:VOC family protein n=1 Tax=unclassified Leisingera TaxID=2614906 RepID=UPI0015732F2C|nr:VOC family protein [Leisingera sp. ANG59]NSY37965.1 VOC family protein [Leisingera sp. ANG59]